MSTTDCNEFLEQLDAVDGGRALSRRSKPISAPARIAANLIADLDSIRDTASSLAADDPEPSARVWTSLRAQLEEEGLIRAAPGSWRRTAKRWLAGNFLRCVPRPVLAGAYLVALIAVAFALSGSSSLRNSTTNRWMSRNAAFDAAAEREPCNCERDTISAYGRHPIQS